MRYMCVRAKTGVGGFVSKVGVDILRANGFLVEGCPITTLEACEASGGRLSTSHIWVQMHMRWVLLVAAKGRCCLTWWCRFGSHPPVVCASIMASLQLCRGFNRRL